MLVLKIINSSETE